jgi:hypothetical protein
VQGGISVERTALAAPSSRTFSGIFHNHSLGKILIFTKNYRLRATFNS